MKLAQAASAVALFLFTLLPGCAGPGPELAPIAPLSVEASADGGAARSYDFSGDGVADYVERLDAAGRLVSIRFDSAGNGALDGEVRLADPARLASARRLLIILDSVPWEVVDEVRRQGRFAAFGPPSHIVAPFPVLTDLSLNEFFARSPAPGAEAEYFDRQAGRLVDPYKVYFDQSNAPWLADTDYNLPFKNHWALYLWPDPWFARELHDIQAQFTATPDAACMVGYCAGTSALGARYGRSGHVRALIEVDRLCQWLLRRTQGRLEITLMSDHGHHLGRRRIALLSDLLTRMGYHVGKTLKNPDDVIVPEFDVVTYAGVFTRSPERVARDLVGCEGMELTAWLEGDAVRVVGRPGAARITRSPDGRLKYAPESGDPLGLAGVLKGLASAGKADAAGFVSDADWFDATMRHEYPDAVDRLWGAFHGLVVNVPDVLVSTDDEHFCGSPFMARYVDLIGAHGNLRQMSTYGFMMTTAGDLPPFMRMRDARADLAKAGFALPDRPAPAAQ
ncbi:MAG: hypothetical protein BIFFINMI_01373 [Phycisphaerae bacterium]|nr:hypothetical protein [Phycisphaerae bacterium]